MQTILTTDVWTEQYANHRDVFQGAFIDGFENGVPYDKIKVVKNCNCLIKSDSENLKLENRHHAIIFYKEDKVVRLLVLDKKTSIETNIALALGQIIKKYPLKYLFKIENISIHYVDLREKPVFNNCQNPPDIGSCDRKALLNCMLTGQYTEDSTNLGKIQNLNFVYYPEVKVNYYLKTDDEIFEIKHKGVLLNKDENRIIIIQEKSGITEDYINSILIK